MYFLALTVFCIVMWQISTENSEQCFEQHLNCAMWIGMCFFYMTLYMYCICNTNFVYICCDNSLSNTWYMLCFLYVSILLWLCPTTNGSTGSSRPSLGKTPRSKSVLNILDSFINRVSLLAKSLSEWRRNKHEIIWPKETQQICARCSSSSSTADCYPLLTICPRCLSQTDFPKISPK